MSPIDKNVDGYFGSDVTKLDGVTDSLMQDGFDITDPTAGKADTTVLDANGKPITNIIYQDNPVLLNVAPPAPSTDLTAAQVANQTDVKAGLTRMRRVAGM